MDREIVPAVSGCRTDEHVRTFLKSRKRTEPIGGVVGEETLSSPISCIVSNRMSKGSALSGRPYWFRDPCKLVPLLLAVAILAAYSITIRAPFIFDDLTAIRDNPNIHQLW